MYPDGIHNQGKPNVVEILRFADHSLMEVYTPPMRLKTIFLKTQSHFQ